MLISTATSFSLASIFTEFFDSTTDEPAPVRSATARFFFVGELFTADNELDDGFRSVDNWRRLVGDTEFLFALIESCRDGVATFTLLSVNGTFDMLLMPSFLLRFCAFSKTLWKQYEKEQNIQMSAANFNEILIESWPCKFQRQSMVTVVLLLLLFSHSFDRKTIELNGIFQLI